MPSLGSLPRLLVAAVAVLVAIDAAGGLIAIATDVNEPAEAWGPEARLAAPWPMILFQIAATALAVSRRQRVAIGAAALLAAACLISGISGFFDGAFGAAELSGWHLAFQVLLISWTALVGVLAGLRAWTLLRGSGPAAAPLTGER